MAVTEKFQFRVNLAELLDGYTSMVHAVGSKKNKPILQMVYFEIHQKKLIMRAFNNFLQIERSIEIINEGPVVALCVPTFMFTVLQQYDNKKSAVQFSQMTGKNSMLLSKFRVSQEKRSNEFTFVGADNYPVKIGGFSYKSVNLSQLLEAFRLTIVGASDVAKKPALRCFHLDDLGILATGDGKQFAKYDDLKFSSNNGLLLLRAKFIQEENKLLTDISSAEDCEVGMDESWLGFRSITSGTEIIFQQHNGDGLDLVKIFDNVAETIGQLKEENGVTTVDVSLAKLRQVLGLCVLYEEQALANAYPAYTSVDVTAGGMNFEIQIEDLSKNNESVEVLGFDGPDFSVKFLSSQLKKIIGVLTGDTVRFTFYSKSDPFMVTSNDYPNFCYLQAP